MPIPKLPEPAEHTLMLSSEHLSAATKGWLNVVRGGLPYIRGKLALNGISIGCGEDPGAMVPDDLRFILAHARNCRYRWVLFFEDAAYRLAGLPLLSELPDIS